MILYLNKMTNEMRCFGSLKKLSEVMGLNANTLYENFSRKGNESHETEDYKIVKVTLERSKRK